MVRRFGLILLPLAWSCGAPPPDDQRSEGTAVESEGLESAGPAPADHSPGARDEAPVAVAKSIAVPAKSQAVRQDSEVRLTDGAGSLTIACRPDPPRLAVTAASFLPIGSEDRFALGINSEPVTLVADPSRQGSTRVAATGLIPPDFERLFEQPVVVSALYGTQRWGPVTLTPESLSSLAHACGKLREQ